MKLLTKSLKLPLKLQLSILFPANTRVYSTLKRRGKVRFHVVLTWNTRGVFGGRYLFRANLGFFVLNDDVLYKKRF